MNQPGKPSQKQAPDILLGLIGGNIATSQSPLLHVLAGRQNSIEVRYDRLVPEDLGQDFASVFAGCAAGGYRGVNITYPYKEAAASMVRIDDPLVKSIAAVNTVIFDSKGPVGHNTDHTGFIAAFRHAMKDKKPGRCALFGAGGAGRAIAFGLAALGADEIRLFDLDLSKADCLAISLEQAALKTIVTVAHSPQDAARGAHGLINCTPLGMDGIAGSVLEGRYMGNASWAFDAVYTPPDTQFLIDAEAAGLAVFGGYELFFHQGIEA
ncbi:MAG TPA: shikimate dehydrogenase, partial [Rhizobiales bacterium]|nr:shikimate dehydrogenase [Hyphomicrobiales bacterium]